MKKSIISIMAILLICFSASAQQTSGTGALQSAVTKLDQAKTAKDYQALEKEFVKIGASQPKDWLPNYYAAYCNARIGFLLQDDGDAIEPYSDRGELQAKKAESLLDKVNQKKELSELYTVMSMINQSRVFINPMTYGPKYGPTAQQFLNQAKQLNPDNPRAIYLAAWFKYNTPKMWGGDKDLAKQLAIQSLKLLEGAETGINPHWGKAEDQELLSKYK
jgi:hypothetical protein